MMCNQSKTISHDSEPQRFKQFKQFNLKQFKRSQTIHQTISNGSNNTNNLKQTRTISNNLTDPGNEQWIQSGTGHNTMVNDTCIGLGAAA